MPEVDYILITHNHYDHLDRPFLKSLKKKKYVTVIVPEGLGKMIRRMGYGKVIELAWHKCVRINGIDITALPAYHYSRRGLFDENTSHWCGFLIGHGNKRFYHAGDTGYGQAFKTLGERYGPIDFAMVGIGAYQPSEMMKHVHTSPDEAFAIAQDMKTKCLLPMHWGTVALSIEPIDEPIKRLRLAMSDSGSEIALSLTNIGELMLLESEAKS